MQHQRDVQIMSVKRVIPEPFLDVQQTSKTVSIAEHLTGNMSPVQDGSIPRIIGVIFVQWEEVEKLLNIITPQSAKPS